MTTRQMNYSSVWGIRNRVYCRECNAYYDDLPVARQEEVLTDDVHSVEYETLDVRTCPNGHSIYSPPGDRRNIEIENAISKILPANNLMLELIHQLHSGGMTQREFERGLRELHGRISKLTHEALRLLDVVSGVGDPDTTRRDGGAS